jgi:hypothetical protein
MDKHFVPPVGILPLKFGLKKTQKVLNFNKEKTNEEKKKNKMCTGMFAMTNHSLVTFYFFLCVGGQSKNFTAVIFSDFIVYVTPPPLIPCLS